MGKQQLGVKFWIETVAGGLAAFLSLLTIFWQDWIEAIFDIDPDNHSGAAEWVTVTVLVVVTAACSTLARLNWLRVQRLSAIHPPGS